jgi:hypothetical protein
MQGSLDDPKVTVNPLAVLAPGFLRNLLGIITGAGEGGSGESTGKPDGAAKPASPPGPRNDQP